MRYQKEFEYISETIEKLNVTITNQSEALLILAEDDFDNDNSKDLTLLCHKLSHFWNLTKHHGQNLAFQLELDTVFNHVVSKLSQESLTEVECSLLSQQAKMLVPLLKAKQSVSLGTEESFNQLRDAIGSMLSTNGCYDINHLTPYLEKGHIGQKLSLMSILNELCPDNATCAFPKCGENCSNNELISPSPTHAAEPSNVISTSTKADLFGEKKAPISELSESKKIRKNVQKIQSPGVHKMKFKPSHKITDSQITPIKSPNISCDSTVPDTGIPKSDSSKMVLEVQDTKQNYKTKALKMSKGSMPQMSLVKRRKKCGKIKKIQTPRMYKKKHKFQLDMRAQWSKKTMHTNNARLHNNTLKTKFIELRGIMKSVIGAFHNTPPLQDRLLLKRPRVKIK